MITWSKSKQTVQYTVSCPGIGRGGSLWFYAVQHGRRQKKCHQKMKSTARWKRCAYQQMKAGCFQIKMMKLLKEQEDMNMTENM